MDDEFKELEAELKRLRPRAPSAELQARVAGELAPRQRRAHASWAWAALPLAAAFAVLMAVQFRPAMPGEVLSPTAAPTETVAVAPVTTPAELPAERDDAFKPVAAENVLYDSRDDGIITLADGSKARRVRNAYVDTITWRNPQTKASLRWSVPRNEVRVVPVSFQ